MLKLSCHCGLIRIETGKAPDYIHECNCSLCSKAGARWAYFHPSEVDVDGATTAYRRDDKAELGAEIRFCPECGSTTHFTLTENAIAKFGNGVTGVNMRLADEDDLAGIELRFPDGKAWPGQGDFSYVREPRILSSSNGAGD